MKRKFFNTGKRSVSVITAAVLTVSLITVSPKSSFAGVTDKPQVKKAGSISVSEENVTGNQPFTSFTAGSKGFRIPALIALKNGDLLGTADARWERFADGGGLDTIASVSSDGGKTWHYSFPIFFPDSNGFSGQDTKAPYWSNATTIIDSCILEGPDGTVYCFADVNPTGATTLYQNHNVGDHADGYYIGNNKNLPCNGSVGTGTGYVTVDGKRRLALTDDYAKVLTEPTDDDIETYPYYVGDFKNGYAPVLKREDHAPTRYGVDEWYNLYTINGKGEYVDNLTQDQVISPEVNTDDTWEIQQNVYYEGSELHIYCVAHIWMVTSKDHGRTWTNPVDIGDQVKRHENEHAILVSPGQGMVTSDGTMVFGVYDNSGTIAGEEENASIVYSNDRGKTWKRTEDVPDMWSSENEIIEIEDGKGTLRMFFRNGHNKICYADAEKDDKGEYHFSESVITDVTSGSGCNLSAISYSKKIDGKQAVMVACPSTGRSNGKIHVFLVNEDTTHTMELINAFSLGGGGYAYSCLTEQTDGSLALLWEKGNQGGIFFNTYDIHDVIPNTVIDGVPVQIEIEEGAEYTMPKGETFEITAEPDASCAAVFAGEKTFFELYDHSGTGNDSNLNSFSTASNRDLNLSDAEFTFTASGEYWQIKNKKNNVYLTNSNADSFFSTDALDMKVIPAENKNTFYISQSNDTRYVIFYPAEMNFNGNSGFGAGGTNYELALFEKQTEISESDVIPGYRQVSAITGGKRYLIARVWDDNNIIILYPVNGKFNQTKRLDLSHPYTSEVITISGKSEGYTQAVINGEVYKIHVTKDHPQPDPACSHAAVWKNKLEASCESEGYTGDEICTKCGGIIQEGTILPALGHDWDEGTVGKAVTKTENGEITYRCQNDVSHIKTESIYVSAYAEFMEEYHQANDAKENEGLYTTESIDPIKKILKDCSQAVNGRTDSLTLYETTDILRDANAVLVKKTADVIKSELQDAINTAEQDTQMPAGISEDIWTEFTNARINAALAVSEGETADDFWLAFKTLTQAQQKLNTAKDLKNAKDQILSSSDYSGETLETIKKVMDSLSETLTDPNATAEELKNVGQTIDQVVKIETVRMQLKNEIAAVQKQLANTTGYTAASVNALKSVLTQAQSALAKLDNADADTYLSGLEDSLKDLSGALSAIKGQKLVKETGPKNNDSFEADGMRYQIISASDLTARLVKGKDAAKLTINTVNYAGKTFKIVEIGDKAFNGCKKKLKKVTIGANVTAIGKNAFKGCKKLANVIVQNNSKLNKVGGGAFKNTSSKIKVKLPKNLKKNKNLKKQLKKAGIKKGL